MNVWFIARHGLYSSGYLLLADRRFPARISKKGMPLVSLSLPHGDTCAAYDGTNDAAGIRDACVVFGRHSASQHHDNLTV
jgi:hypothetical protein